VSIQPEARGVGATAADRLNQGPQPPHSTPTSDATWWGDQSARANLGSNSTLRQIADSHAHVGDDGQGHHCHHFVDRGVVGPASTEACQQHLETINEGRSRVPREHLPAVRVHLVRHLRDAGAAIPRSIFEPVSGRAAQCQVEEWTIAERIADRQERLADL
jgi:hypothetical protein